MRKSIVFFTSLLVILSLALSACAAPTPEVIEKEVVVEKPVVQTVVVEKEVVVEKPVVQTVVVEKEVVVEKPVVQTVVVEVTPVPEGVTLPDLGGREVFAATTGDCPPWNSVQADGTLTGMEVEMMEEICRRLNCTVTWRMVPFVGLIPGLVSGDFDVGLSNMTHTRAREERVLFSEHYYRSGEVVVVRADETRIRDYRDLGDLDDVMVGSETGTLCEVAAREYGRVPDDRLLLYEGLDTLFLALINGDIDAIVDGTESAARYVERYSPQLKIVGEGEYRVFSGGPVGIAVTKNEPELRDAVSAAIIALREDGTINALLEEYDEPALAPEDYEVPIPEGR